MNEIVKASKTGEMQTYGEQSPWREFATKYSRSFFAGEALKFVKGDWVIGQDKRKASLTEPLVANMEEIWAGWIRFDDGAVTDTIIGRIVDRFRVPPRESLGDEDKIDTEHDPWAPNTAMMMRNASGDLFTVTSLSDGGRSAVATLADQFDRQRHKSPGKMPIVLLGSGSYYSKKHRTNVPFPTFKIVGWDFWGDEATAAPALQTQTGETNDVTEPKPGGDLVDDIPF
jgi:hypothetical protein